MIASRPTQLKAIDCAVICTAVAMAATLPSASGYQLPRDRERIYVSYWRLGEIGALIIAELPGELRNTGSLGLGWSLGICILF